MRRLVIFDLDGTLLYTLEDLTNSVNFSLDLFGYETKTLEEITSFVGNGVEHLMRCAVPKVTATISCARVRSPTTPLRS